MSPVLALKRPSAPPPEGLLTGVLPTKLLVASSSLHDPDRKSQLIANHPYRQYQIPCRVRALSRALT
jgi:hypothetical protein